MTSIEQNAVLRMRKNGASYNRIAEIMHLSENTVKSCCRRHRETEPVAPEQNAIDGFCRNCGKPLTQPPGKKTIKFCSAECRTTWWNSHPDCVNRRAIYHLTCAHCGKAFDSYGKVGRKYCCRECYFAARFGDDTNE